MKDINDNMIAVKSKAFALRMIRVFKVLTGERKEFILSKQALRSGTSIGANVREGIRAQTKADFRAKMCVALKEASETEYWLELLQESDYLNEAEANSLLTDCRELIRILMAISKTSADAH